MTPGKVTSTQNVQDVITSFNEVLFTEYDQIKRVSDQFKNINLEKDGYPIFRWRNHWLSIYNATLATYISQLIENEQDIDQSALEVTATQLIESQAIIKKLLLLEELHKGDIGRMLAVKQDSSAQKIVKNTEEDLFADLPNEGGQIGESLLLEDENAGFSHRNPKSNAGLTETLGEIKANQAQKRVMARVARGSAAKDIFEAETTLPAETTATFGFTHDKKVIELEEELQRPLTRKERKKLEIESKNSGLGGETGWNERDILDGIGDKGENFRGSKFGGRGSLKKRDRR